MFRSERDLRTYLTILMTSLLDFLGYSIVFPILASFLLNPDLHYFAPDTAVSWKTTVLGLIFAAFGIAQLIGAPFFGTCADHYGRYKVFLWTIGMSVVGYVVMTFAIYWQDLTLLFVGRIVTGFCSGNFPLAQSATADLTTPNNRSKAFGLLMGTGTFGWIIGPWFGGKLANLDWLYGCGAFIFAAIASAVNFLLILFFFTETREKKAHEKEKNLLSSFKDIRIVLRHSSLRTILIAYLVFSIGWAFCLIFSSTFFVQRFSLGTDLIGDIYAYWALIVFFVMTILNKELGSYFSIRTLLILGLFSAAVGCTLFLLPKTLWPYWFIIPLAGLGGGLTWTNLGALLSIRSPEDMQGRALGAGGSMWSIGQVIAPLLAGPLAGWNLYAPLTVGSVFLFLAFIYFSLRYREIA